MLQPSIQWNWYARNHHAIVFYYGSNFLFGIPISKEKAKQLIDLGMNHGS